MATILSDADRDTLSAKVAKLVTDQQSADAADEANTAAQAALSSATSAASAASSTLSSANATVLADEQDLTSFVEGLLAAQQAAAPAPTPAP
jgi:hypothetical protein